eukprot:8837020-Prorocentrum_lima.AAC.1
MGEKIGLSIATTLPGIVPPSEDSIALDGVSDKSKCRAPQVQRIPHYRLHVQKSISLIPVTLIAVIKCAMKEAACLIIDKILSTLIKDDGESEDLRGG